ncbi:MAG: hypothetical protein Q4B68_00365 [Bacteroidales bacterium]|nr:hypothetical protein [Bacteroidales bacterium]
MHNRHIFAIATALCIASGHAQPQVFTSRSTALEVLERSEATLGNPLSEEHDEVKYVEVLKTACESEVLSESDKMRYRLLLKEAQKNHVGTLAADIEYVTPDGSTHHLSESAAPLTLVYFNDPDCDACEKVVARLDTCATLKTMVLEKQLEIVGIYPLDDEQAWLQRPFPSYIINGWNKSQEIDQEETYVLPTMPLFYLLDADKRVVLKNEPSLNHVLDYLRNLSTK